MKDLIKISKTFIIKLMTIMKIGNKYYVIKIYRKIILVYLNA